jgi:hypothetical protein
VALSNEEQRLLEQMEQALAADDPKLANALRGTGMRRLRRRRAVLAGLGFLAGMAALVAGMDTVPIVSILGFVVMLAAAVLAITSWQQVGGDAARSGQPRRTPSDSPFMDKLDERWRRGHDDGT